MNTLIEVLVNGRPTKQYAHSGRTYIESRIGTEYSLKIRNNRHSRRLAVVTVDGLNVITGLPDEGLSTSQGYVVPANSSVEIKGFRVDNFKVGAFKFCKSGNSYCAEKGLAGNNGVIGVRFFEEKIKLNVPEPWRSTTYQYPPVFDTGTPKRDFGSPVFCCSTSSLRSADSPGFSAGTTWGSQREDRVTTVEFDPYETPLEGFVLYYDTRKNLQKIGINFSPEKEVFFPQAFPSFATPPRGWTG